MHLGNKTTPVYIQTPSCSLKDGTFTKVGKNTYVDFIFPYENTDFLLWMEKLEKLCQKQLNLKQNDWFESQFTEEDIDNLFITPFKSIKGKNGKMYSVRTNLPITKTIKIFNEEKEEIEYEEPFHTNEKVISIVELIGIKCSPRNFHIDFEVKQMMLIKDTPLFSSCLINTKPLHSDSDSHSSESIVKEEEETNILSSIDVTITMKEQEEKALEIKTREEIFKEHLMKAFEKAKTARHLGIMTFLKSGNYHFDIDKLNFD